MTASTHGNAGRKGGKAKIKGLEKDKMDEAGERGKGSQILRLTEGREIKRAPREQRMKTFQLVIT